MKQHSRTPNQMDRSRIAALALFTSLLVNAGQAQVPGDAFLFVDRNGNLFSFDPGVRLGLRAFGFGMYIATYGNGVVFGDYYDFPTGLGYVAAEVSLNHGTYAGLGVTLYAQVASLSGGNALGLATSESLVIRFR